MFRGSFERLSIGVSEKLEGECEKIVKVCKKDFSLFFEGFI